MSNETKAPNAGDSQAGSAEERFRRERRKLFGHALVGVPVVISIMAKPAWAGPGQHSTNFSCHSMLNVYSREELEIRVAEDPAHFGIGTKREDGVMFQDAERYFAQCEDGSDDGNAGGGGAPETPY